MCRNTKMEVWYFISLDRHGFPSIEWEVSPTRKCLLAENTYATITPKGISCPASHDFYSPETHITPPSIRKAREEGECLNSILILLYVMTKVCGVLINKIFIGNSSGKPRVMTVACII